MKLTHNRYHDPSSESRWTSLALHKQTVQEGYAHLKVRSNYLLVNEQKDSWDLRSLVALTTPQGTPEHLLVGQEGKGWPLQLPGSVLSGTALPSPVDSKTFDIGDQAVQPGDPAG